MSVRERSNSQSSLAGADPLGLDCCKKSSFMSKKWTSTYTTQLVYWQDWKKRFIPPKGLKNNNLTNCRHSVVVSGSPRGINRGTFGLSYPWVILRGPTFPTIYLQDARAERATERSYEYQSESIRLTWKNVLLYNTKNGLRPGSKRLPYNQ